MYIVYTYTVHVHGSMYRPAVHSVIIYTVHVLEWLMMY